MRTFSTYYGTASASPAYSDGSIARIINNTKTDNLDWAIQEVNQSTRYLVTRYYFNERTYTMTTGTQVQFYNLPPQVKKLINVTVTIGGVVWVPSEVPTRDQWDKLNVIPFYQDYPSNFYVYNGQVGLFPIPATAGNTLTMNYKTRIPDLSMADITSTSSGRTVSVSNGTTTVTASGTSAVFHSWMAGNGWMRIPHSNTDAANGDNQWYQIASVTSGTQVVLANPYTGSAVTGGGFTVGECSILPEDYQDLPLYRMAYLYYSTRFVDPAQATKFNKLWTEGLAALDEEFATKTTSVALPDIDTPFTNPNLYQRHLSQN